MKPKRWTLNQSKPTTAHQIAQQHHISPLIAQILVNRDITSPQAITEFLQPSLAHLPEPLIMKDMQKTVDRLIQAIQKNEPIMIYGDYDVDGTTATALLMDFFQAIGANIQYYIPHRIQEGYSLNAKAIEKIAQRGIKVLITVDNGISAVEEAKLIKKFGMDLIITDHHEPPPQLPQAYAILNPKQQDDPFPGKELAGVGVAYYLLIALRRALREANSLPDREPNLRQALDLVAVGTIADLAPLQGLNRILVREGLKVLSHRPRLGLKALLEVSGVEDEVRSDQIAFRVGPRINAVGRLDDANLGVKLMLSEDPKQAKQLAEQLNEANIARKTLEDKTTDEAIAQIETLGLTQKYRSLVVFQQDWHPGVVGIVASRLVERFYLPAIVLTNDSHGIKGSARSIRNLNLVNTLRNCESLLDKFGGHAYAAGLSLRTENLESFRHQFDQKVQAQLKDEDFIPALVMETESQLSDLNAHFLEELKRLEPFGLGNPTPLFLLKQVTVKQSRIVGEKHLKMKVGDPRHHFDAIAFRLGEKQPSPDTQVNLAFFPEWNEWNGVKNIQLRVVDLEST